MKRLKVKYPVIVEGKYDKNTLSQIIDTTVVTTSGFAIFNSKEKQAFIRRIGERGIILLTDSDGGGRQIRSFLLGILPSDKIHNLYIPEIEGKEKRKKTPSKAGLLGVEGMSREVIERLFAPFADGESEREFKTPVTRLDFYNDGFSGGEMSAVRREALAKRLDLPSGMTAKALLEAINLLYDKERYELEKTEIDAEK